MILKKWDELPKEFQTPEVKEYYDILSRKRSQLVLKRLFDVVVSIIILLVIWWFMALIALAIVIESKGPVFFRQERVTQYGRRFKIFKFRSMVANASRIGSSITQDKDPRITKVGRFVRKIRADEFCQVLDVLRGTMTFVGTRPEVPKYVEQYTAEMMATLLLPAGVTSEASIYYKDEEKILKNLSPEDVDKVYVEKILPEKMKYNLQTLKKFTFGYECKIMWKSVWAVLGKNYTEQDFEVK
ncbi:MAG: sugar transferase [Lachnospiraceae bacterium]|nr:sugar transferase [Lachnospiraceae bacterium]